MKRLVLGTRGSDLARAQTSLVEKALRVVEPELALVVEIIRTRGDEKSGTDLPHPSGRKGLFTGEIEGALVRREIDIAVHSAKDLPSEATPGLEVCATLPRAAVEDLLIAKGKARLEALPAGATVATGSVRRQHQLRWRRRDLTVVDLRGNVPTRLRKLIANPWDAIILARAGLDRLGLDTSGGSLNFEGQTLQVSTLPVAEFLPAGGQGVIALQIRSDDAAARRALMQINHPESLWCLRAEREFLRLLAGDCGTPVGVLATMGEEGLTMRAQIFDDDAAEPRVAELQKTEVPNEPEALAAELWELIHGG